jgi:hypothetical protein
MRKTCVSTNYQVICLAEDRNQCQVLVNVGNESLGSIKDREFLN